jgi:LmbE family N-acetylglucosaminyl deacetylase
MKKVNKLMIVAHPDDELVFGGAELIKYGEQYKVVCISYKNDKIRSKEFQNVMKQFITRLCKYFR